MNWFSSLFGHRSVLDRTPANKRNPASRVGVRMVLQELERRDCPSTFLQVVSTPNYPTIGTFDALSATVSGTQYQYAGIQFGVKLASSASALPGNSTPDFYAFCVDITADANLSSAYQVTPKSASAIPNGNAIAYLYDTYNSAVGSPLNKTQAAGLQLAIWEAEYGTNIVTANDVSFMNSYNGATETTAILNTANSCLKSIPCNPCDNLTVYTPGTSDNTQSLIGPPTCTTTSPCPTPPSCHQPTPPSCNQPTPPSCNSPSQSSWNLPTPPACNWLSNLEHLIGSLTCMDPPTVSYWRSSAGQALIDSLNGGASSKDLGKWLANNFANLYGAGAGKNDLAGKTNAQIATYYDSLTTANQEVLAAALSVYASSSNLAGGTMGASAGLPVTAAGLRNATVNVGLAGEAFGATNGGLESMWSLLEGVNTQAKAGVLYGKVSDAMVRAMLTDEVSDFLDTNVNQPTA